MTPAEQIEAVLPLAREMLPTNASPLEIAMLATDLAALADINPGVIATIWNPETCPAVLLPWLAWALSVDVWDPAWSEARKRAVIGAAPAVHRLKGTLGAVKRTLAAFGLEANVVEWWEDDQRRGTFRVDMIYRNGGPEFDTLIQQQALLAVKSAKPKSRVFGSRAVVTAQGPSFIGVMSIQRIALTALPYAFTGETVDGASYIGAVAASFLTATISPKEA